MKDGIITKVSGPLVEAIRMDDASINDVVEISENRLIGEIIEMKGGKASIQVYEDTTWIGPGEPVYKKGHPFSVELAPGLLGQIFDGIQRPLDKLSKISGAFLARGVSALPLDREIKDGLHIFDDHFYPEIIDTQTLKALPAGEKGELVLTTLTREGMPVIRFRTRDITALRYGQCECGRTHVKMDRITGRSDDMLKIRGVIVFPSQIERALLKIEGLEPQYQIIVSRPQQLDELEVQVEASPALFSDEVKYVEEVKKNIEQHIHNEIGIRVNVTLVEPQSLPRSEGKAVRIIDKRELSK